MQSYTESLTEYKRLPTKEVRIGDLLLGNNNPIRVQTMTTTDTMNTMATVEQSIRCIEAGAELIRITAPSKKEAENLLHIKNELRKRGYQTPLVADIHFTPNAAEIAARIVEKVRVNPGNYVDKKKFELLEYSDQDYAEEIERIRDRFTPLVKICKEYGTAMRIGTNHGSLSDRIMSRYGDTPMGMVESAMEFLRIARGENYHQIVLSMKSSNPKVMVQAYRLLVKTMHNEWGEIYPLHLGVTEAGDGEDGRIKSALGIGTLLEDGLGDTIRVSLTEEPEFEIPVCNDIVKRYGGPSPTTISSFHSGAKAPSRWEGGEESESGPSPSVIHSLQERAKAPSRWEGGEETDNILQEDTVGYRFADPSVYSLLKDFSLKHRAMPTPAEGVMWEMLKTKKLEKFKFRRQHVIDRFITDFVCLKRKLVIEIDGLIHSLPENKLNDEERSLRLSTLGFKVIRFTNEQILNDIETTLQVILSALKQQPEVGSIPELSSGPSPTIISSFRSGAKAPSRWEGDEESDKDIETTFQINLTELKSQTEISSVKHLSSPPSDQVIRAGTGGQGARESFSVDLIGGHHVPAVIADLSKIEKITIEDLQAIGYNYNESLDKWTISDTAPDYIFTGVQLLPFDLPGTLKVICYAETFSQGDGLGINSHKYFPIFSAEEFVSSKYRHSVMNFVMLDCDSNSDKELLARFANDPAVVLCFSSTKKNAMQTVRSMFVSLMEKKIKNPVILITDSAWNTADEHLVHYAIETGALLLDGLGNGICLGMNKGAYKNFQTSLFGEPLSFPETRNRVGAEAFINNVAFGILQATRTRISKTEYISCPSCGRTLFDLQETTAKIRAVTNHLKGVKIAIMGCIVNGPGEMADADFGYVGSGPGKITLYKGKEIIKRNVPSEIAVVELVNLLKENGAWVEKEMLV